MAREITPEETQAVSALVERGRAAMAAIAHYDQATERQRRDGMCWQQPDERYNGGSAFKVCARDAAGLTCHLATADGFGPARVSPILGDDDGFDTLERASTLRMGDVDGDGKSDVCARAAEGMRCWLSDGEAFVRTLALRLPYLAGSLDRTPVPGVTPVEEERRLLYVAMTRAAEGEADAGE